MLVIWSLVLFIGRALSWNTCHDEEFCNKIRHAETYPAFSLVATSINHDNTAFTASLNSGGSGDLTLKIVAIKGGIFRVTVDDPSNPRTEISQTLDGQPEVIPIKVTVADDVMIESGGDHLKIESNPFKISAYRNGELVLVLNERSRMVFTAGEEDHAVALDFTFPSATVSYGIPLHAERLALQSTENTNKSPYRLYNVDHCCYTNYIQDSLYGAEPVLYGHGANSTSAIFWLNAAQTFVDIDKTSQGIKSYFISESGLVDIFILTGGTFKETVAQYVSLTGVAPLPQLFALGYQQSRWSYATQEVAEEVVRKMDAGKFPFDAIWFDVDYMDGKRSFTWNYTAFPDPVGMQQFINSTGRKVVLIIDPHYKVEEGYFVYDETHPRGFFVHYKNGTDFQSEGWPQLSSWFDFLNPEAAELYSTFYSMEKFKDTTDIVYVWNDMNEPEVFNGFERSWTRSQVYHNHGKIPNTDVHNIFGFSQVRSTYKGYLDRNNNRKRPFILSRSHFSGSQRYAVVWTGDNNSTWEHLEINFPMCLSLAISGISFCGADIGGFAGNLTHELYQRWYQAGAWFPFYRAHVNQYYEHREPYLYPANIQTRIRNALNQRYHHLPLWYTLFYEHELHGEPVVRPLVYEYPSDVYTHEMDDQWLVGKNVLVHPVQKEGATDVEVYLPGDDELWYGLSTNSLDKGRRYVRYNVDIDTVPVFYKGGSVIVRKDIDRLSSVHTVNDPFTFYVFLNEANEAEGTLYIDDYESFDYRSGQYRYVRIYSDGKDLTVVDIDKNARYGRDRLKIAQVLVYSPDVSRSPTSFKIKELDVEENVKYA